MRIHYPGSFLKLLLIGFAFAIFPLLWAFTNANIAFDKLAEQSEITIYNAVRTTRAARTLQEQVYLMERSIRQYYVLQDDALFMNYKQADTKFDAAVVELQQLTAYRPQLEKIHALRQQTRQLNQLILNSIGTQTTQLDFLDTFSRLTQQIETIIEENNREIDKTSSQLTLAAKKTQRNLLIQSLVLIPLALLVAGCIAFMLARPIRRMDKAIKALGEGYYDQEIAIDGPGNLRVLGQRLDWLRAELKELNEQKQQFLRHISHELKTPLTAIREATELLNDGIGGSLSVQQAEITHILRDNTIRLQRMIENLLDYTKLESIQRKLDLQTINLPELMAEVIGAHELSIRNKQLVIETISNLDRITADREKLTIIMDNLVSNAVRYSPDLGHIKIRSNEDKSHFIIEVIDDGPGLDKADQEKLFSPFYRGTHLHKSLISGSGLGLAITKDLAEAHDGSIELAPSQQGAHFIVTLPKIIKTDN
ncbi:HAMP domain-containing sensor histidine kinase [Methylotenera sp. G11]|uniref:HAMP domain-containing sensor histidine kinase n=1 Tax=Methylotenera sp. G11 TaxID=1506585 RepID=UPI000645B5BC|nr:HAMP domain-containing sensor histidine kinase [Methylotenera sp. G11]